MASVKIIHRTSKTRKNGEAPLYIRLTHKGRTRFVTTGLLLEPKYWDAENFRVRKSHPQATKMNYVLTQKKAEIEELALDLEAGDKSVREQRVREALRGASGQSFIEFTQRHRADMHGQGRFGTARTFDTMLGRLEKFLDGDDLAFDQVTVKFLNRFEKYLLNERGVRVNTVHATMKTIRRIMNLAMAEGIVTREANPFPTYRLKQEKTERPYLREAELDALYRLELKKNSLGWHWRNMYVFAAYAAGIRFGDLCRLRWMHFDGTRISWRMQKTGGRQTVKLPGRALEILSLYQRDDAKPEEFIFPLMAEMNGVEDDYELYRFVNRLNVKSNQQLKKLAKRLGLSHNMSFHSSRHTFATLALRRGMRIEYVSKLMGHSSVSITQIYAKIVNHDLEDAMDLMG